MSRTEPPARGSGRPADQGDGIQLIWRRVILAATLANMAGMIPFFFVGAFGPSIRATLLLDEFELGLAAASFNVGAMLGVFQAGRFGERFGYRRAIMFGSVVTILGMLHGSWSGSFLNLLIALTAAGCGNALVQPAANAIIARYVPAPKQGLAFGLKQGSVPAAAVVAGFALATFAATSDWRQMFIAGALTPIFAMVVTRWAVPSDEPLNTPLARSPSDRGIARELMMFGIAALLASSAASAVAAFATESAVNDGLEQRVAGLWYAWGAGIGVFARIAWGALGFRLGHRVFIAAAVLMTVGSLGPVILASQPDTFARAAGTALAWGAGWGWPGLFHYGIVTTNPESPATASGVILTGLFGGSVVGPALFGAGVTAFGWTLTWYLCAACFLLASAALVVADRRAAVRSIWPA